MSYMDVLIEQAVIDGHLPGETQNFFNEARMQQYFQQVVENEGKNKAREMGAAGASYGDMGMDQDRAQDGVGGGD